VPSLRGADYWFTFGVFLVATLVLIPGALYFLAVSQGAGTLVATIAAVLGLAIGARLTMWWLKTAKRKRHG
jgi:uncharacterized membrane protein YdjX (TVP38/TMEM64 family)